MCPPSVPNTNPDRECDYPRSNCSLPVWALLCWVVTVHGSKAVTATDVWGRSCSLFRVHFLSLHSNMCEFFGPYFSQGSLISHGYPWTLPPGWQGGFCMPQVLGTMRSRTLEEGRNSLLMGTGRWQNLAGWKRTAWLSCWPPAMFCKNSYKLPAELLSSDTAQAKAPLPQASISQSRVGPPGNSTSSNPTELCLVEEK